MLEQSLEFVFLVVDPPLSLAVHSMVNQDCVMETKVAIIGKTIIVYVYHVYLPKFYHTVEPLITDPVRKNPHNISVLVEK